MAKIIHLVRHGESKANALGIYQGQTIDTNLTAKGRKQAKLAARGLKAVQARLMVCSPMLRTYETAKIINQVNGLKIKKDKRLLEINHGTWEGKTVVEFNEAEKRLLEKWQQEPDKAQMIRGENLDDVQIRCEAFIDDLPEGEVIVVTHDVVIRLIVVMALEADLGDIWKFCLDNGGVTTVKFEPDQLVSLNQNFHLNDLRSKLNRQAL